MVHYPTSCLSRTRSAFCLFVFLSLFFLNCGDLSTPPEDEKDEIFTSAEWELIQRLSPLPANPPPSLTNRFSDNPQAATLGQRLFFDRRFSLSGTVACATCHVPDRAFSDGKQTSIGIDRGNRNAPTILNSAYNRWYFWDGRKDSLWSQSLAALEGLKEHGGTRLQYAHLIFIYYRKSYETIFGLLPDMSNPERFPPWGKPGEPTFDQMSTSDQNEVNRIFANIGKAIEAYERRLISRDSPFDQFVAGYSAAIHLEAKRGLKIFIGKGRCIFCHDGPNFTDDDFHNLGLQSNDTEMMLDPQLNFIPTPQHPIDELTSRTDAWGRFFAIGQLLKDSFNSDSNYSDNQATNLLKHLTPLEFHLGQFKTPTLRNIALTAPYSHSGRFDSLQAVIDFYDRGGDTTGFLGVKEGTIIPLHLSQQEKSDLIQFLHTLTGQPQPTYLTHVP